jgi:hypothetical protein
MLTFKQGKFYNNLQQIVPLEHGNKEQIEILKKVEALRAGIWIGRRDFDCLCGHSWYIPEFKDGLRFGCTFCKEQFQLFYEYDDFGMAYECMKML